MGRNSLFLDVQPVPSSQSPMGWREQIRVPHRSRRGGYILSPPKEELFASGFMQWITMHARPLVRETSLMWAEHGACAKKLCWGGCGLPHSFPWRSLVHPQRWVRCGWINSYLHSCCISALQSTLHVKPVPKTCQALQPSKAALLKITHFSSPPTPLTVSPCLGADKSYLSYSLHSVSDRRLVSSEKMKCKFY